MIIVDEYSGSDDEKLAKALEQRESLRKDHGVTLMFTERQWQFWRPHTINYHTALVGAGSCKNSSVFTFNGANFDADQALLTFDEASRGSFRNIMVNGGTDASRCDSVLGIHVNSGSSFTFANFIIDMQAFGHRSMGIRLCKDTGSGNESIVVRDFEVYATCPVIQEQGDHIHIYDFDLTVGPYPNDGKGPKDGSPDGTGRYQVAGIQGGHQPVPEHVTIGPGTIQKGLYPVYFRTGTNSSKGQRWGAPDYEVPVGNVLELCNIRYEQGEYVNDSRPVWVVDLWRTKNEKEAFEGIENVIMRGCRHPVVHKTSYEIAGDYTRQIDNQYLPGDPLDRRQPAVM